MTATQLNGDPAEIRASATRWTRFGESSASAAAELRALSPTEFDGDEGVRYRDRVADQLLPQLDTCQVAWTRVGAALRAYADELEALRERMRRVSGQLVEQRSTTPGTDLAGRATDRDPMHAATAGIRADHAAAVRVCCARIEEATALRFLAPPGFAAGLGQTASDPFGAAGGLVHQLTSTDWPGIAGRLTTLSFTTAGLGFELLMESLILGTGLIGLGVLAWGAAALDLLGLGHLVPRRWQIFQGALADFTDVAMSLPLVGGAISTALGFEATTDAAGNEFYTTNQYSVQSHLGFMDLFDHAGPALGMDLDTVVATFTYGGREYRLQLWKGNYGAGSAFGGEIGLYVRDPGTAVGDFYPAAVGSDRIHMVQQIYDTTAPPGTPPYFTSDGHATIGEDQFWNLAIATQAGVDGDDLGQRGMLEVPDPGLRAAMAAALARQGVAVSTTSGSVVYDWR